MRSPASFRPTAVALCLALELGACGPQKPASGSPRSEKEVQKEPSVAPQAPVGQEPPLRQAFVGQQPLVLGPQLAARVDLLGKVGDLVALSLVLPDDWRQRAQALNPRADASSPFVEAPPALRVRALSARVAFAILNDSDPTVGQSRSSQNPDPPRDRLWILTEASKVSSLSPTLSVNFSQSDPKSPQIDLPIKFSAPTAVATKDFEETWGRALYRYLRDEDSTFSLSARQALDRRYGKSGGHTPSPLPNRFAESNSSQLTELMSFASGKDSVERALERNTLLTSNVAKEKPGVAVSSLSPPALSRHDWQHMLRGLSTKRVTPELSKQTPAEFYFVQAMSGESFFHFLDELDVFLTPAARLLEERTARYELSQRYQTMLGVDRGPLTRLLGPDLISEIAIVGSDPFFKAGSDLTIILRAKDASLLALGFAQALGRVSEGHGSTHLDRIEVEGRPTRLVWSDDGAIHRILLEEEGTFYLTNSQAALTRILKTKDKKHPALSDEPDFRYMLNRDDSKDVDLLAYAGDSFIESIMKPELRVLDARRAIAWAELRRVSHRALLNGFFGRPIDADPKKLIQSGLLEKTEAAHFDGTPIQSGPVSKWGRPAHLVPLIELSSPTLVTRGEAQAYRDLVQRYQGAWAKAIDPIALRLRLHPDKKGFDAHLRVLPVIQDDEYRRLSDFVGSHRMEFQGSGLGLQSTLALSKTSGMRNFLSGLSGQYLAKKAGFDWVGDYVFAGVEDRNELANTLFEDLTPDDGGEPPRRSWDRISSIPLYAGVEVKNRASADLLLTALKLYVETSKDVEWLDDRTHLGTRVEGVRLLRSDFRIFFALGTSTLFVSLREGTIRRLLELEKEGKLPQSVKTGRAQLGVEFSQRKGGGLFTVASRAFQKNAEGLPDAQFDAELLFTALKGAGQELPPSLAPPELLKLLGRLPTSTDGFLFELGDEGAVAPERGSLVRREWPKLPILDSTIDTVLSDLSEARFEVAFDEEAPGEAGREERSLSVHVGVRRR